eukprot:TRINITY_DN6686_c0_g1_i1.p1 TRINITY_DN6686_c0_g1~~TRINITY_DN6686_c0_g1_i1.p1  ORF type:complete len:254 (-),score=31.17 TRINITY_DN6686_c0_g1_i1:46-780(-)
MQASSPLDLNFASYTKDEIISSKARVYLEKLFVALAASMLSATLGCFLFISYFEPFSRGIALFGSLLSMGFGMAVQMTQPAPNDKLDTLRASFLLGFAFFSGFSVGPLLDFVIHTNPESILKAIALTAIIFGCFFGAAIFAPRKHLLYLGGILGSALTMLFFISFFQLFFPSEFGFNVLLYGGLLIFSFIITFQTQVFIENAESGRTDYVRDSLSLFSSVVQVFIRVLIILNKNNNNDRRKKRE